MIYEIGDLVKYSFPEPGKKDKDSITGRVIKSDLEKVVIQCVDNTKLVISFKNFEKIELLQGTEVLE